MTLSYQVRSQKFGRKLFWPRMFSMSDWLSIFIIIVSEGGPPKNIFFRATILIKATICGSSNSLKELGSLGTEGRIGEAMPNSSAKQTAYGGEIVTSTF
jgi:hypothetical protein